MHKLAKILGGYHFGKDNYIPCGLKGCRTLHGKGYVVQTLDGIETNIGKDCGKKHFGQDFEDLEGQFTRLVEDTAKRERVQQAIRQKVITIERTKKFLSECRQWESKVEKLFNELNREASLISQIRAAIRSDSALVFDRQLSATEKELSGSNQQFIRETLGRLNGLIVIGMKKVSADLQAEALAPLHELSKEQLNAMSSTAIKKKAEWLTELESTLNRADFYIKNAQDFCSKKNWNIFAQAFEPGRFKTTDRGRTILKKLATQEI